MCSNIQSCECQKRENDQKLTQNIARADGTSIDAIKSAKIPYTAAINWAKDAGVMTGDASTGYTTVRPNDLVSRQELAIMLARFANGGNVPDTQLSADAAEGVVDTGDVSDWAEDGMFWAVNNGVMSGTNNADGTHSLNPQGPSQRCEAAKMISVTMRDLM